MYRSLWRSIHKSVCSLDYHSKNNILFYRSTGFRYKDYLISEFCGDEISRSGSLIINFCSGEEGKNSKSLKLSIDELTERISEVPASCQSLLMAIPISHKELSSVPSVSFSRENSPAIGTPVAIFSHSSQLSELLMKTGLISSYINKNGKKFIYLEASIETGCSGAPVVNALTGEVIGMVADCFLSLPEKYKKLKAIINQNIQILGNEAGKWPLGSFDFSQLLVVNQHMIKKLAKDMYLSSHRDHGFSLPVEVILRFIKNLEHRNQFQESG